ncbi:CCHC-type domain-containing protein [Trichonephila clavipes]|nr:CCHC-type domain-containing protein [Trichonephila clavipes]
MNQLPSPKRSRRRKTSKTSDAMDTDADPSDTDYVTDDVKDIILQYSPVCVALQETFLKSCHTTKIRRYDCVRKDTEGSSVSGSACIFTSLDVPSSALPLHTSLQAVAVRIHSTSLITVCCLYLPRNAVIHQQDLNNLVDQLPAPFVILGDFNGHSTLWGSVKMNPRSRQIEQISHYGESLGVQKGKSKCSQSKASDSEAILDSICVLTLPPAVTSATVNTMEVVNIGNFPSLFYIPQTAVFSPDEIANILGETFQSVSSTASMISRFLEIKRRAERGPQLTFPLVLFPYNCDFTMTELKGTLTSTQYKPWARWNPLHDATSSKS